MLVNVDFKKLEEKLNLIQAGNDFIGAYLSYSIENNKAFENIPCLNNLGFITRVCGISFHIGGIEFRTDPSLTIQLVRYKKRDINNKAEKLKDEYNNNEITKIAKQCTDLIDHDLNSKFSYVYLLINLIPYIAMDLYMLYYGRIYAVAAITGVSFIAPRVSLTSEYTYTSDADIRFDQFTVLLKSCADDQDCLENAYQVGLDLCSPLSETIFGPKAEEI